MLTDQEQKKLIEIIEHNVQEDLLEKEKEHPHYLQLVSYVLNDEINSKCQLNYIKQGEVNEWLESLLDNILNQEVDLISKRGIKNSRNYLLRQEILNSYEVIYVKG